MHDIHGSSPAEQPMPATEKGGQNTPPFRIVAIGAGSGGLEAIQLFFAAMPAQRGLTFIICRQAYSEITDHLGALLCHQTSMPVYPVEHGTVLRQNAIYLIPSEARMVVLKDRLISFEDDEDGMSVAPLDLLLHALAASAGPGAIALLLSGTGDDGLRGAVSIRRAGGLVLVQEPGSADVPDRLNAVIEAGLASANTSPEAMPGFIEHFVGIGAIDADVPVAKTEDQAALSSIFQELSTRFGIDLDAYRKPLVTRRVRRRATLSNAGDLKSYAALLAVDDRECEELHDDLMIGVTAFFRDPDAFERLAAEVVPTLIDQGSARQPVRIWVPACATGEEAYSLAMLITDQVRESGRECRIEIVATDRHRRSLEEACLGSFHRDRLLNLPAGLVERYMEPDEDRLRIGDDIRDLVIFRQHDMILDPPLQDMHLVSCRNLLIYLAPEAREKALDACRQALTPDGFLFLGPSEVPGPVMDDLSVVDRRWRIYRKTMPKPASPVLERLPDIYRKCPAETIMPERDVTPAPFDSSLMHGDDQGQPGIFDGMMEQNQQMLESTIDTLLASNDALRRRNRDLRLENQRLNAANAALEDVATMVAHDLKAPLRTVDHLARRLEAALQEAEAGPASADDLHHMQLRLVGLHRLIDDLLTFARLEANEDNGVEPVELGDMIREILVLIGLPPGFRLEVRPPSLLVHTCRIPLECVLRNLLGNAIEHHGGSKGSLQIAIARSDNALDIRISDDGQSMTGRKEGLGLAIVRQLLAAKGGHLELTPRASGSGTDARFTWPIEDRIPV